MNELNSFVVANAKHIPCTVRTLKPFWSAGELKPWCHIAEILDASLYLAARTGLPPDEIRALKELHENLLSSLNTSSATPDHRQDAIEPTENP